MPRKNHYLPQFYQRRWASPTDPQQKIFAYEKPHDKVIVHPRSTKATGWSPDLYTVKVAAPGEEQALEDEFWRVIDQWGSDAINALENSAPELDKTRWAIFLLSLALRNPEEVAAVNRAARQHYTEGAPDFADRYDQLRFPYEPTTICEFMAKFSEPGLSGFGAQILKALATNRVIIEHLLMMDWQVVTLENIASPLLTSDRPLIRYKGLKHDDGLLMLPLGPFEFFVAYNRGEVDMKRWIDDSIRTGTFTESMNKYVVQRAIRFVYGIDDEQTQFVAKHFPDTPLPPEILSGI